MSDMICKDCSGGSGGGDGFGACILLGIFLIVVLAFAPR